MLTASVGVFAEETENTSLMTSEMIALRDEIAGELCEISDGWTAMDMVLYEQIPNTSIRMSQEKKQEIISSYIQEASDDTISVSDRARLEIVLKALCIDSDELYLSDSETPLSNAQKAKTMDLSSGGYYSAPWILLADTEGNLELSEENKNDLINLLSENCQGGNFGYEYDGVLYTDYDTAAVAITSLIPYYNSNETAKLISDQVLASMEENISESGSFGSANTDAMVIISYIALGENPAELKNSITGKNVIDGLMSYVNDENDGFTFYGSDNFLATEQGFRALVALSLFDGNGCNIYDFSANEVTAGYEIMPDNDGEDIIPPQDSNSEINVTLSIKASEDMWVDSVSITVNKPATVCDAFVKAIEEAEMLQIGAETGYVKSITKGDTTLKEFDMGKNSGWLYKVNDIKATVSLVDYVLNDGDDILWYYEADWKTDEELGDDFQEEGNSTGGIINGLGDGYSNLTSSVKKEENIKDEEIKEETIVARFEDAENHWANKEIASVTSMGIMNGITKNYFAPNDNASRAQIVTMFYRLSDKKESDKNSFLFDDVAEDAWYKDAVIWAYNAGIANGTADNAFAPDKAVSREELAVFLYRFAKASDIDTSVSERKSIENESVSPWSIEAVLWALDKEIIKGREDGSVDATANVTRAEIAVIFTRFLDKYRS